MNFTRFRIEIFGVVVSNSFDFQSICVVDTIPEFQLGATDRLSRDSDRGGTKKINLPSAL